MVGLRSPVVTETTSCNAGGPPSFDMVGLELVSDMSCPPHTCIHPYVLPLARPHSLHFSHKGVGEP